MFVIRRQCSVSELLQCFELWSVAAEVIKLSPSVTEVHSLSCISTRLVTSCSRCAKIHNRAGWLCERCSNYVHCCSIWWVPHVPRRRFCQQLYILWHVVKRSVQITVFSKLVTIILFFSTHFCASAAHPKCRRMHCVFELSIRLCVHLYARACVCVCVTAYVLAPWRHSLTFGLPSTSSSTNICLCYTV